MQKMLGKFNAGFGLAAAISIIFTSLLVIIKETNKGVKEALKSLAGHHWVAQGIMTLLVLMIVGLLLSRLRLEESWDGKKLANIILTATILGGLIITIFFLVH